MDKIWPILAAAWLAIIMLVASLMIADGVLRDVLFYGAPVVLIVGEITAFLWIKHRSNAASDGE
ncbi:MAG: hypothetical protein AAGH41_06815 [Pseudomonadota bacterium]